MNPPWPAELDQTDPEIRLRRTRIALDTVIARIRPGNFSYAAGMSAYLLLVPHHGDLAVVGIALGIHLVLAIVRTIIYRRIVGSHEADADRSRRTVATLSFIVMFVWDTFTAFEVWHQGITATSMLLVAASLVLRASGTYAASPDLFVHRIWSRWTRAPLVIAPLFLGTGEGVALATMFVGHMLYAEAQSKQLNAEFWRTIVATDSLAAAHVELRRETAIRQRAEVELRLGQKLESVGRLAAGIAHEINTPLQALLGSLDFIGDGVRELFAITGTYRAALPAGAQLDPELVSELDYLAANLPDSLALANECLDRTATIVKSVKTFAHPSSGAKAPVDLNHALATTLSVARHACVAVADVVTDFGSIPLVDGYAGELNQVFLNLVINAVDAMEATGARGTLGIATRYEDGHVRVEISDTGVGIEDPIKDSVFDPFFTTKAPGKGTGQGLMIAHTVITQRHGGELRFESPPGRGTTFIIRLPVAAPATMLRAA